MRLMRLALPWKRLVAVAAAASVAVLVTGALASPSEPVGGSQFQLIAPPASCPRANRLGWACVDRPQIPGWTISDGGARWDYMSGNQLLWQNKYLWAVPNTVTPSYGRFFFKVEASAVAIGRICPAIIVSGFTAKGVPGQLDVGVCAEGVGKNASAEKTVQLLPPNAAAGSIVALTVRVQDGPIFTYTYRALAAKEEPKGCRAPRRSDAAAAECGEIAFVFSQGGLPKAKRRAYLDMTTNGVGRADVAPPGFGGVVRVGRVVVRVVRTVDYLSGGRPTNPIIEEARLVLRPTNKPGYYNGSDDAKGFREVKLFLTLVASNDPECRGKRRDADLVLSDGRGEKPDSLRLTIDGCPDHGLILQDRSHEKPPRKPLVRVVITEK